MAKNFNKAERYLNEDGEYKLLSYATSSESVEMTDGTDLQTKMNAVDKSISDETTRAKGAESTLTTNLNSEISRAKSAESTLTTNLNNEISRAKGAETTNANEISSETTRATAKENEIANNLSSHTSNTSNPHSVTKAQVGLGNVENKSSATIRGEITKSNVTTALGYTPYTPNEIDNKFSALETNIDWKESVSTFDDIATTYPNPVDGWTVNVKDTDYTYRYNGTSWVAISANAIPKATNSVDGLLSKEDHINYEDANSKKHTHSNKSVIDGISSTNVSNWNSAKTHADSTHARTDATKVEASSTNGNIKINGTETTVYTHPSGTNPHGTTKSDVGLGNVDNTKDIDKPISTKQQEKFDEINSNLSQLEFGEVAAGKNLFKGDFIKKVLDPDINYTDIDLSKEQNPIKNIEGITFVVFGAYLKKGTYTFSYTNDAWFSLNRIAIAGTNCIGVTQSIRKSYTWTQSIDGWTYFGIEGDDKETGTVDTPFSITPDIMIEKGSTATTPYEPYIPSVKMLAEEVNQQNESLAVIGKCKNLLNPTFDTYTSNGVTFTRNDDETYTLSGSRTDTSNASYVSIIENLPLEIGKYKITGALNENNYIRCIIKVPNTANKNIYDYGKGVVLDVSEANTTITLLIISTDDTSQTRIIKPMLTTNLNATYDDFVPYTGDGDTLTHDVAEIKNDLSEKAPSIHTHTKSQITDFPTSLPASDVYAWAKASSKPSYSWNEITSKPSTFTPASHTHNYAGSSSAGGSATSAVSVVDYADSSKTIKIGYAGSGATTSNLTHIAGYLSGGTQIKDVSKDTLKSWLGLGSAAYTNSGAYATSSHTHSYAGSSSVGGSATSAVKLDSSAGSATQPVYFSGGKPVACTYTLGKSVPSNAVFTDTNTWRGITTSLTSTSNDISLAASAGKSLQDQINTLNTNFSKYLNQSDSGKFILPNLKICWATNISTNNLNGYFRTVSITFPVNFTSTPTVITGNVNSLGNTAAETNMSTRAQSITTSGCTIKVGTKDGLISDINCLVCYIAIGY